ncbi:MAG: M42 family metallopeptidase [Prevotellaceae bacterium]|jgi:endoglucanase|nr:M42 family metallopeptidase [Prevotellaceae bacterium]
MDKSLLNFFIELLESPSPSGFEQNTQNIFKRFTTEHADEVQTDKNGNVFAIKRGKGKKRIMLIGHGDEIGLMVKYVTDDGYIHFVPIGGIDLHILQGSKIDIHTKNGAIRGVIGRKPWHLMRKEDAERQLTMEELWIDIGAKDKTEALNMVSIGDPITFAKGVDFLPNGLITSKAIDNKVGIFIVAAVIQALKEKETDASIYAVSGVQEEISYKGSHTSTFQIAPDIGIAVDVTHATDYPSMDKRAFGDIKINGGAVIARGSRSNPRVFELLTNAADKTEKPYQIESIPADSRTDAEGIHMTREGAASSIVSIPCRYMHTPGEIVSLNDVEATIELLTEFCLSVKDDTNLNP